MYRCKNRDEKNCQYNELVVGNNSSCHFIFQLVLFYAKVKIETMVDII